MKMWKRWTAGALAAVMLSGLLTVGASAAGFSRSRTYTPGQFTDVADTAWYAPSVKDCYELGLMSGASATAFNPTGMFTLAEAATIAARMHSIYQGGSGTVPSAAGAWYQGAVDYCVKNKIFAPGDFADYTRPATRAEMAGMIAAALPESAWTAKNSVSALPDVSAGTPNSEAIFQLYNAGVFTGSDAYGQFQPYAQITRAEVAAIVARCADPAQRKTLSLTPLSQREAPELLGGYNSDARMSNGRLKFQDPETKKWGYLDGNGNVVIAPVYDSAENFESGFAKVEANKGKYGLIDLSGNVVVPIEQDNLTMMKDTYNLRNGVARKNRKAGIVQDGKLVTELIYDEVKAVSSDKNGCFYAVCQDMNSGLINSGGKVIVPIQSQYCKKYLYPNPFYVYDFHVNGIYGIGKKQDGSDSIDIYDLNGTILCTFPKDTRWEEGSHLFSVQEGNKYALYSANGRITEAVYDRIELKENSDLAVVSYGDQNGLAGLNGEIIAPGAQWITVSGEYAFIKPAEGAAKIADSTGITCEVEGEWKDGYGYIRGKYGDYFYIETYHSYGAVQGYLVDSSGHKAQFAEASGEIEKIVWYEDDNDLWYVLTSEGQTYGPYTTWRWESYDAAAWNKNIKGYYFVADNPDDTKDVYDASGNRIVQGGYLSSYRIGKSSSGKPIVEYGNSTTGRIPVIEYYKNNLYYDEIKELGEEYYACRYNTTWYLVHA